MIDIEFSRKGDALSLTMRGHAGYSASGSDIVCAAVSGIFYALIGYLANECRDLHVGRISSGVADIGCSIDGESAMKLAYIGFLQIGLSYPGTLKIRESVWNRRLNAPSSAELL